MSSAGKTRVNVSTSRAKKRGAKKGGAGRHTWGVPGEEMDAVPMSKRDPMYNSDDDDFDYVAEVGRQQELEQQRWDAEDSPPSLEEFKTLARHTVTEFFESRDLEEVAERLEEAGTPVWHHEFIKRAVSISLDRHDTERELVSCMLPKLLEAGVLNVAHFANAFDRLCAQATELERDVPGARTVIATFLARCVADDCLPPAYLTDPRVGKLDPQLVREARQLLSQRHAGTMLQHAFADAGTLSVSDLKASVRAVVAEYFSSLDAAEVSARLRALASPHFHHEVTKRIIVTAIDRATDAASDAAVSLLVDLHRTGVLSPVQLVLGFNRVLLELGDLAIDVPRAPGIVSAIAQRLADEKALGSTVVEAVRTRQQEVEASGGPAVGTTATSP